MDNFTSTYALFENEQPKEQQYPQFAAGGDNSIGCLFADENIWIYFDILEDRRVRYFIKRPNKENIEEVVQVPLYED